MRDFLRKVLSAKAAIGLGLVLVVLVAAVSLGTDRLGGVFFEQKDQISVAEAVSPQEAPGEALPAQGGWALVKRSDEVNLLTRLVAAESTGEPYEGQVAVASVLLNRVRNAAFPNTISGVIYQPHAFESVTNGLIWRVANLDSARKAAIDALNGWDPTYGALYFWNPYKPVSGWIWTRRIVRQIGRHVFGI